MTVPIKIPDSGLQLVVALSSSERAKRQQVCFSLDTLDKTNGWRKTRSSTLEDLGFSIEVPYQITQKQSKKEVQCILLQGVSLQASVAEHNLQAPFRSFHNGTFLGPLHQLPL